MDPLGGTPGSGGSTQQGTECHTPCTLTGEPRGSSEKSFAGAQHDNSLVCEPQQPLQKTQMDTPEVAVSENTAGSHGRGSHRPPSA